MSHANHETVALSRAPSTIKRFSNDRSGAIAIIFALSLFVIVTISGGAIDYGRHNSVRATQQAALDAAVLAAGRVLQVSGDTGEAIITAQRYYDKMKSPNTTEDVTSFDVVNSGTTVRATSAAKVSTPFWAVAGITHLEINLAAEAKLAIGGNSNSHVEVSLMLDVTGSMGGDKIDDLKLAAKDLIDILVWEDQSTYTSKVALAPFSKRVNVGNLTAAMTGLPATSGSSNLRSCVTDRTGDQEFTDAAPGPDAWMNAYNGNRSGGSNYSGSGNCTSPDVEIMPLSNDKDALKTRIDNLPATGTTAGALGTAMTWYMLSPNWNSVWPSNSQALPYSLLTEYGEGGKPKLQKIAVLMTDGEYNTDRGNYDNATSNVTRITNNAVQICTNMKAAGITVYSVGFQIDTNSPPYTAMRDCATDPSYFYNSTTGDELRQAFRDIALKIATLRISK